MTKKDAYKHIHMLSHPMFLLLPSFTLDFNNLVYNQYVSTIVLQDSINASIFKPYN
jgi:general stress protein CsbA